MCESSSSSRIHGRVSALRTSLISPLPGRHEQGEGHQLLSACKPRSRMHPSINASRASGQRSNAKPSHAGDMLQAFQIPASVTERTASPKRSPTLLGLGGNVNEERETWPRRGRCRNAELSLPSTLVLLCQSWCLPRRCSLTGFLRGNLAVTWLLGLDVLNILWLLQLYKRVIAAYLCKQISLACGQLLMATIDKAEVERLWA
ncbi:uncharacterized protein LOC123375690 [Mauremys mutica]|uniref:uncharacterized protein LOC123375690 n=1 Tax=Mauremys mutica TaxID=74926 RepID=UPI001D1625AD|nr:uncharacterized protein LOC123375690 [Mauremys mutica]